MSPALQARAIVNRLNGQLRTIAPEAVAFAIMPPSIPGLGSQGGFSLWLQDRSGGSIEFLDAQTAEVPGGGAQAAGAGRRDVAVHGARAAGLCRRRSRQGAAPGRRARRCLSDDADVPGRAVREPVQPVRTAVARVPAGGRARIGWRPSRSGSSTCGTTPARWCRCRRCSRRSRRSGRSSRTASTCIAPRRSPARRRRATARARRWRRSRKWRAQTLPREIGYDWADLVVSGETGVGRDQPDLRAVAGLRVPDSRGALRELVAAVLGAADGADRGVRRVRRPDAAQVRSRRLRADRRDHADRPGGQERDPDRRVREVPARGREGRWSRRRSKARGCGCGRS